MFTCLAAVSCSNETDIAPFKPLIFSEDFPEPEINFNATFDFEGWTNFAETGTKLWIERDYNNDGYIQFSPYGSNQPSNIGWAITPEIQLGDGAGKILLLNRPLTLWTIQTINYKYTFLLTLTVQMFWQPHGPS